MNFTISKLTPFFLVLTLLGLFNYPVLQAVAAQPTVTSVRTEALSQITVRVTALQDTTHIIDTTAGLSPTVKATLDKPLTTQLATLNTLQLRIQKDNSIDNINTNLQKAIDLKILRAVVPQAKLGLANEIMYGLTESYTQLLMELEDYNTNHPSNKTLQKETTDSINVVKSKVKDGQAIYPVIKTAIQDLPHLSDPDCVKSIAATSLLISKANTDLDESDTIIKQIFLNLQKSKEASKAPQTLLPPAQANNSQIKANILMYHYVRSVDPAADPLGFRLSVLPAQLEQHLTNFKQIGYTPTTMADLAAGKGSPSSLVLTFDDGYADFYTAAYPLLKKYGYTATVYIITAKVGTKNYMTWDQIKELQSQGFEIGAHTVDHYELNKLSEEQQKFEIEQSKKTLEEQLGVPITAFCYPVGRYNDTTIRLVKAAGFLTATTTNPGSVHQGDNLFTLSRVRVTPESVFSTKLYKFGNQPAPKSHS